MVQPEEDIRDGHRRGGYFRAPGGEDSPKKLGRAWIEAVEPHAYGICDLTTAELWGITPRDFLVRLRARSELIRADRKFRDQLQAGGLARLLNGLTGTDENPLPYKESDLMSFDWSEKKDEEQDEEEMTMEQMEEFDQNMGVWAAVTRGELHG
jgi:hypothetical protein